MATIPTPPIPIPGCPMPAEPDNSMSAPMQGKKVKRMAAEARIRGFHDLYMCTGESLGRGSFGHVDTYINSLTKTQRAVKMIEKRKRKCRSKVLKEIEILHMCQSHPNILQLVEYFEESDWFYLVFEKMSGGSLLDVLEERQYLDEVEAAEVTMSIALGLQFLHNRDIAHRDLKPENILVSGRSTGHLCPVKICDFDLASSPDQQQQLSSCGSSWSSDVSSDCSFGENLLKPIDLYSPVGSADFMAPEVVLVWQNRGSTYNNKCDIWSLGVIMYVLLCGYKPFYFHERCGNTDCEWMYGGVCEECQDLLFRAILRGRYDFNQRHWSHVSHLATFLIDCMLDTDPITRVSANDVVLHPWFKELGIGHDLNDRQSSVKSPFTNQSATIADMHSIGSSQSDVRRLLDDQSRRSSDSYSIANNQSKFHLADKSASINDLCRIDNNQSSVRHPLADYSACSAGYCSIASNQSDVRYHLTEQSRNSISLCNIPHNQSGASCYTDNKFSHNAHSFIPTSHQSGIGNSKKDLSMCGTVSYSNQSYMSCDVCDHSASDDYQVIGEALFDSSSYIEHLSDSNFPVPLDSEYDELLDSECEESSDMQDHTVCEAACNSPAVTNKFKNYSTNNYDKGRPNGRGSACKSTMVYTCKSESTGKIIKDQSNEGINTDCMNIRGADFWEGGDMGYQVQLDKKNGRRVQGKFLPQGERDLSQLFAEWEGIAEGDRQQADEEGIQSRILPEMEREELQDQFLPQGEGILSQYVDEMEGTADGDVAESEREQVEEKRFLCDWLHSLSIEDARYDSTQNICQIDHLDGSICEAGSNWPELNQTSLELEKFAKRHELVGPQNTLSKNNDASNAKCNPNCNLKQEFTVDDKSNKYEHKHQDDSECGELEPPIMNWFALNEVEFTNGEKHNAATAKQCETAALCSINLVSQGKSTNCKVQDAQVESTLPGKIKSPSEEFKSALLDELISISEGNNDINCDGLIMNDNHYDDSKANPVAYDSIKNGSKPNDENLIDSAEPRENCNIVKDTIKQTNIEGATAMSVFARTSIPLPIQHKTKTPAGSISDDGFWEGSLQSVKLSETSSGCGCHKSVSPVSDWIIVDDSNDKPPYSNNSNNSNQLTDSSLSSGIRILVLPDDSDEDDDLENDDNNELTDSGLSLSYLGGCDRGDVYVILCWDDL